MKTNKDILNAFTFEDSALFAALSWRMQHDTEISKHRLFDVLATFHDSFMDDVAMIGLVTTGQMGRLAVQQFGHDFFKRVNLFPVVFSKNQRRTILVKHILNMLKNIEGMYFYDDSIGGVKISADQLVAIQQLRRAIECLLSNGRYKDAAVFISSAYIKALSRIHNDLQTLLTNQEFIWDYCGEDTENVRFLGYKIGVDTLMKSTLVFMDNCEIGDLF